MPMNEQPFRMEEIWNEEACRRYDDLIEQDCAELLGASGDPVAAGVAQEVPCVFCGAERFDSLFRQHAYRWERCLDCGLLQKRPRPRPEAMARFYGLGRATPFYDEHVLRPSSKARQSRIFGPYLDRLESLAKQNGLEAGALLDVGCSNGSFLALARERRLGARWVGIEPAHASAELARAAGVLVHEALLEDAPLLPESFSIVTCLTTFQLVGNPRGFLAKCKSVLAKGGVLVLTGPNGWAPDVLLPAQDSPALPGHLLQLPDPRSFARACTEVGLGEVHVEALGQLDVEIVRQAWTRRPPDRNDPRTDFLARLFLDMGTGALAADLQALLRRHGLSGHLWMQARNV